jgi:N6-L-threonylcarbamoyladenine synthase
MRILSIETSCDETAAAIVEYNPRSKQITVLANVVSSQVALHNKWGGVVPNLASREHIKNIVPVIEETLTRANVKPQDVDLIAVTQGPGLMPALLIGVSAAKTLSLVWQKPLIGINHLEGHIYANFISSPTTNHKLPHLRRGFGGRETTNFPLLALIVSGGHTQLVLMRKHFDYAILGETQDDAAGEAFDKVAKLLGLPYPGGPEIAKRADAFRISQSLIPHPSSLIPIEFPRPMINSNDYNFSFSGLKTAVLYFLKKHETEMQDEKFINEVCYEFQEAIVDVLVAKSEKAIRQYQPKTFTIAGGVSANVRLRERLQEMIDNQITFLMPEFSYSLDNAAMIASAAALRYELMNEKQKSALSSNTINLEPDANLALASI